MFGIRACVERGGVFVIAAQSKHTVLTNSVISTRMNPAPNHIRSKPETPYSHFYFYRLVSPGSNGELWIRRSELIIKNLACLVASCSQILQFAPLWLATTNLPVTINQYLVSYHLNHRPQQRSRLQRSKVFFSILWSKLNAFSKKVFWS